VRQLEDSVPAYSSSHHASCIRYSKETYSKETVQPRVQLLLFRTPPGRNDAFQTTSRTTSFPFEIQLHSIPGYIIDQERTSLFQAFFHVCPTVDRFAVPAINSWRGRRVLRPQLDYVFNLSLLAICSESLRSSSYGRNPSFKNLSHDLCILWDIDNPSDNFSHHNARQTRPGPGRALLPGSMLTDNATMAGPQVALISGVGYHNYLWYYCGHVPILRFMRATPLRACISIKGSALSTELDSVYTRTVNELSQVSLNILFSIFPYNLLASSAIPLIPCQATLPFRLFAPLQHGYMFPKSLTLTPR
jgi:hypothetical protein